MPATLKLICSRLTRRTLSSIERGDRGVSIGNVAAVLHALGVGTPLSDILDHRNDPFGLALDDAQLPKRARLRKPKQINA